jgi:hypothetical protein
VDTYYPHDYDSSIRQFSAIHLRHISSFIAKALPAQYLKSNNGIEQLTALQSFGFINQSKQSALHNLSPVSKPSLAILKFGRQLFAAFTHHKDACLNHYLGNKVMNDNQWSQAA